ncbi:MAG TPA: NAD(P)-binding protein, partial [Acidobacteriaceae bacterium]|nr:NAD(P)-binding protein [Acidobacteriaceae bacterium]
MRRACVIGSGPNGLAAAIVLARAGLPVEVYEAEATPGGGARTLQLTLPGFRHDFGSAVHPMAASSPFFNTLPLGNHGLQWVHGTAALAHPLDDGTAVTLEHSLKDQETVLGRDGHAWRELMEPLARHWRDFTVDAMGPVTRIPRRPLLMA